jgi:hypothetical protein
MVGHRRSGPRKATTPPLSRRQAWWGKHRRPNSRLTATWRRKSSEPCAPEEEVIKVELDKAKADDEEAKAIAGASVLGAHGWTWWTGTGDHLD